MTMVAVDVLAQTDWQHWAAEPIAGDASARRYHRLVAPDGNTAILMQDPSGQTKVFARIAQHLRANGFAAPDVLHHDPATGTMVLTDLGTSDVAGLLQSTPQLERTVYAAIADVLIALHRCDPPPDIPDMTHAAASQMVDLAAIHYAQAPSAAPEFQSLILQAYSENVGTELTFSLRDFHAQNLIWRAEKSGRDRLGLLDFQDACRAPVGYDLMSMIRDVRRDVPTDVVRDMIDRTRTGLGAPTEAHLACIGAQRNLRILGVFARLIDTGKPQYRALLPRVWRQLQIDLAHPALHDLHVFVSRYLPEPEGS